jgi:hypothetical protein
MKCASALDTALTVLDRHLIHFLRDKGFIPDEAHDEILNPKSTMSEADKAGELVKLIKNRVKQDHASYHTLLDWFKHSVAFEPIAKRLTTEYQIAVESSQQPSPTPSDGDHHLDTGVCLSKRAHGNSGRMVICKGWSLP